MTVAATLATAPLIAFHFEAVSTTTLVANLLALPAVAPAMWLGMLAAAGGQVPGFPVELLNAVNALLLAYIAQVAAWCGSPSWAYPHVRLGLGGLVASYLVLTAAAIGTPAILRHHRLAILRRRRTVPVDGTKSRHIGVISSRRRAFRRAWVAGAASAAIAALAWVGGGAGASGPASGLRVTFLDVGQGDAILLQPAHAPAVLVDGGPPGAEISAKLRAAGVQRLGAAILTHEQSDHAGGIEELLGRFPVRRLAYARIGAGLRREAEAAGATPVRIAAGDALRAGRLWVEVLWPPGELLATPLAGADPNTQALVLLVRWHRLSLLLTGDAEAEAVPIDPGPVDVLKVAHHGSEDAGLGALLDRARPRLAVISVGDDNPHGHPAPTTLATLAAHRVPALRTDRDGTVVLDAGRTDVALGTSD